jgi:topoisomerase-4 subunit A
MRARWRREDQARGQWRIIVNELPHGVSCAHVLSEIETLTNPQPRAGKKEVSQEQKTLKALVLGVLETVRDESSEQAPVRIVLEPRSSRIDPQEFMAVLLAHTSLETSVPINLTMIGRDGRPAQKGLLPILREWIAFRYVTVERRTRHRLDEVDRRLHILDGRMIAFLRIEEVIRVIRESDEPKPALMASFGLTEIQTEDILEIRLRQLARLEGIRIEKELAELREERGGLQTLLDDRKAMTRLILKEIGEDAKKYGDARRSLIEAVQPVVSAEIAVPDEPVTLILSRNGWLRARQGHGIDPATIAYKTGDFPMLVAETRSVWPLVLVDSRGRAYSIRVSEVPGGRGDGVPISTMVEFQDGAKLAQAITDAPEKLYLFANSGGCGFIAAIGDLVSRQKAGKAFMTLEKGERVLAPAKALGDAIAAVSEKGRLLVFGREEMKQQSGGRGVVIMGLDEGESLAAVTVTLAQGITVQGVGRAGKVKDVKIPERDLGKYRLHRARKGCLLPEKIKPSAVS